jgi:hypothetical protein
MLVKIFQQGTAFIGLLHRPIDQDTKRFRIVGYESGVNCERLPLAPNEKLKREANDDPAMAKHNEDDSDGVERPRRVIHALLSQEILLRTLRKV